MNQLLDTTTPPRLAAKELEDHCLKRMQAEQELGRAAMSRYGVQGALIDGKWTPISSLPDFDGCLAPDGREFIFDAKVCSGASFECRDAKFKDRQLRHMKTRSRFGAICFLLIHFNERQLKTKSVESQTWLFPVSGEHPFWQQVDRAETKSLTLSDCEEYGIRVAWNTLPGGRTPRPDILTAIAELLARGGDESRVF